MDALHALQRDEYVELGELVRGLEPDQWDRPSLCAGWTVAEVVAHVVAWDDLLVYETAGQHARRLMGFAARFAASGFSTQRLNARLLTRAARTARAARAARGRDDLVAAFDRPEVGGARRLFDALAPGAQLAEYVVHHQDIRRALGMPREIPADRLVAALDAVDRLPGVPAKRRRRGLQLRATDVTWSRGAGQGDEVRGPGEALLMALAGRARALDELSGPGVDVLAVRSGAAPGAGS